MSQGSTADTNAIKNPFAEVSNAAMQTVFGEMGNNNAFSQEAITFAALFGSVGIGARD